MRMNYEEIKKFLLMLDNPADRLEMVMDIGMRAPSVPDGAECTQILGCSSFVQICRDGNNFYVNADSVLVRGIATILAAMVNGKTAQEIQKIDIATEFASLGINLGAGRLNGLDSMIRFFKNL